uniref:Hexosyltransferase n=1 Tax=Ditylenchus dipsaci TaxID=166011 RepID=A0A915DM91_9BILA
MISIAFGYEKLLLFFSPSPFLGSDPFGPYNPHLIYSYRYNLTSNWRTRFCTESFQVRRWQLIQQHLLLHFFFSVQFCSQLACPTFCLKKTLAAFIVSKSFVAKTSYSHDLGSVQQESGFRIRTIFVMGTESPTQPNQSIFEESKEFEDLLIGNFVDHYRNNTLKFIYSMGLAKEFCSAEQAIPYLLLIDDDYMLSPRN